MAETRARTLQFFVKYLCVFDTYKDPCAPASLVFPHAEIDAGSVSLDARERLIAPLSILEAKRLDVITNGYGHISHAENGISSLETRFCVRHATILKRF